MIDILSIHLSPHQPNLMLVVIPLVLTLTWRSAGPPERACALTLGGVALLDFACWWLADGSALLHALIDTLALSWMVPVALRANRVYPAFFAAALVVAATAQWLLVTGATGHLTVVEFIAGLSHMVTLLTYLGGWHRHTATVAVTGKRAAWRDQIPIG